MFGFKKNQEQNSNKNDKSTQKTLVNATKVYSTTNTHSVGTATSATGSISSIQNIVAITKGEKTPEEGISAIVNDTSKAAATSLAFTGLNNMKKSLFPISSNNSSFIKKLSNSKIQGPVIDAVMVTGSTLVRYANGEINERECAYQLGEGGLNCVTAGTSAAVGQVLIPIPVVGAAVGAYVGHILTSDYCQQLATIIETRQLEHEEHLRIMAELDEALEYQRQMYAEFEQLVNNYFEDCRECFDDALSSIHSGFESGNLDDIVKGANQITRKLGGKVNYETREEFEDFLANDEIDRF